MRDINEFELIENPPKFFGIDIDKTFYTDNEEIYDLNKKSFKYLKSNNIIPFFCTSRYYDSAKDVLGDNFFKDTGYNGFPGVYSNGCCVFDENGKFIYLKKFTKEFLDEYLKFVKDNQLEDKVVFISTHVSFMISEPHEEIERNILIKNVYKPQILSIEDVYKYDIVSVRNIKLEDQNIKFKIVEDCITHIYGNVVTISPPGTSKAEGIKHLLKHFNSNLSECAYIGDSENDIEALEYCTLSFVVNNAKNEVKKYAKWVVDLNYDQGAFAKVVELLYGK